MTTDIVSAYLRFINALSRERLDEFKRRVAALEANVAAGVRHRGERQAVGLVRMLRGKGGNAACPMDLLALQPVFVLAGLAGAVYTAYDLVRDGGHWLDHPVRTVAQVWLVAALGLLAIEYFIFGQNAVLATARALDVPATTAQVVFVASIVVAALIGSRE
ncbi:MAG: hypothetical protein HYY04_14910 [Chloroflexi bacterium]|nr:hypothetical protein [Chloroflexota bacterium]